MIDINLFLSWLSKELIDNDELGEIRSQAINVYYALKDKVVGIPKTDRVDDET